jgi:transketolase
MASVNLSAEPEKEFDGFWGATSTYASFSYLVYGSLRLYSQLAQDCQLKTARSSTWRATPAPKPPTTPAPISAYSPPASPDFSPRAGHQPPPLGIQRSSRAPGRRHWPQRFHHRPPPDQAGIQLPDRAKLGIPSYFEAAKGAYVLKEADPPGLGRHSLRPGTSAVDGILRSCPDRKAQLQGSLRGQRRALRSPKPRVSC